MNRAWILRLLVVIDEAGWCAGTTTTNRLVGRLVYMRRAWGRGKCIDTKIRFERRRGQRKGRGSGRGSIGGNDLRIGTATSSLIHVGLGRGPRVAGQIRIGLGGAAVEHGKGRVDANLKVAALGARGVVRVEAAEAQHHLDPVIDIDVFPAAVRVQAELLVLGHHLAGGDLHVGLELGGPPHALETQLQLAEEIVRGLGERLGGDAAAGGIVGAAAAGHFSGFLALVRGQLAAANGADRRVAPVGIEGLSGHLFEEENLAARVLARDSLVIGPVLGGFGQKDFNFVNVNLVEGRQLKGNGNLGANGEALAGNDNVVVELIFPLPAYRDGLRHFLRHLIGQADNGDFLDAVQIRLKGTGAVDGGVQLPLDGAVLKLGGLELVVVDGKLKGVVVGAGIKDLVALGLCDGGDAVVAFIKAPRLDVLQREAFQFLGSEGSSVGCCCAGGAGWCGEVCATRVVGAGF